VDQHVWNVEFEVCDAVAQITLTFDRLLPDGTAIKFDEDPNGKLNLAAEEDERLVMDGFLALIPDGELLSCALRDGARFFGLGDAINYKYVFVDSDRTAVDAALDGRLWNPDSSRDYVFVGGESIAHQPAALKLFVKELNTRPTGPTNLDLRFERTLSVYRGVAFTEGTLIRMIYSVSDAVITSARQVLAQVASRYGYVLPA
jgi:hypothetical protein